MLLLAVTSTTKKQVMFVVATLSVILALPIIAVFSLGTAALSILSDSSSTDSVAALSTTEQGIYEGPEIKGDTYAWGNCTYWAFALRLKADDPIPTTWGNANTWDDRAIRDGYIVDHVPAANAVMQTDRGDLGHVAYVTVVDPITGKWTISEMNAKGLDIVDLATYSAAAAKNYTFIHDKGSLNALLGI